MYETRNTNVNYRIIFSKPNTFFFDEKNNIFDIHTIYSKLGIPYFESTKHMVDLDSRYSVFRSYVSNYKTIYLFFIVIKRKLFAVYQRNHRYEIEEIAYVHLMGRSLTGRVEDSPDNIMIITPQGISSYKQISSNEIEFLIKYVKYTNQKNFLHEVDVTKTQAQITRETYRFINDLLS